MAVKVTGQFVPAGDFSIIDAKDISGNITASNFSGSADSTGSFGHLVVQGNITASGTVRADAFESVTGGESIEIGDSLNIIGNITASGNISGSSTSTGSFGALSVPGQATIGSLDITGSIEMNSLNPSVTLASIPHGGTPVIRFVEGSNFRGGFVKFDGASNVLKIGTHEASDSDASNDIDAITMARGTGIVTIPTSLVSVGEVTAAGYIAGTGAFSSQKANILNNFNNFIGLVLKRTGTGTADFLRLTDSSENIKFSVEDDGKVFSAGDISASNGIFGNNITALGNISGSATSTGSFGKLEVGSQIRLIEGADSFIKGGDFGIGTNTPVARLEIEDDGTSNPMLLKLTQDDTSVYGMVIGNDTYSTSDSVGGQHILSNEGNYIIRSLGAGAAARFGAGIAFNNYNYLEISGSTAEFTTTKISGSATSTGSFGLVLQNGSELSTFLGDRGTETLFSGSVASTGSFGTVQVADEKLISNGKISLHGLNTYPNQYVRLKRGTQTQLEVNGATGGVAMGAGASATGDGVGIGYGTTAGGGSSVAIGRGLTTTANQVRIGESGVTDAYLGQGNANLHINAITASGDIFASGSGVNIIADGNISGSVTSTGSFGELNIKQQRIYEKSDDLIIEGIDGDGTGNITFRTGHGSGVRDVAHVDYAGAVVIGVGATIPADNHTGGGGSLTVYNNQTSIIKIANGTTGQDANSGTDLQLTTGTDEFKIINREAADIELISNSNKFIMDASKNTWSGSVTSTGSFGRLDIVDNISATSFTGIFQGAISGSAQIATQISGAFAVASASFASDINNLQADSASFSTRVTDLKTDSGSFSTRVTKNEGTGSKILNGELEFTNITGSGHISMSLSSTGSFGRVSATTIGGHSPLIVDSNTTFTNSITSSAHVSSSMTSTASFGRVNAVALGGHQSLTIDPITTFTNVITASNKVQFDDKIFIETGSIEGDLHIRTNENLMRFGKSTNQLVVSASISASRFATGSDGSIIDLGFTAVDEEGNVVLTGEGDGIHVDSNNYWYNNKFYRVGNGRNDFLVYDDKTIKYSGEVVAQTGSFAGEMYINSPTGSMFIGKFTGGIPSSGSDNVSRFATGSDGSIIDLGFTTTDEDGNVILTTTGDGIHVDDRNYWYTTGHFKIGDTNNFINWNTSNLTVSGTFTGDGSGLTGVSSFDGSAGTETLFSGSASSTGSFGIIENNTQIAGFRPIVNQTTDFSASLSNAGRYHIVHGNLTCSIGTDANMPVTIGAEYEFFQSSSVGKFLFQTGSGVSLLSKNNNRNIAGQHSGATLKKVAANTFHLVGDLT